MLIRALRGFYRMKLIPIINELSERYKPFKHSLEPSDFFPCKRNMWFQYRNVKPVYYDVRDQSVSDTIKRLFIQWAKASGFNIIETPHFNLLKHENEFYLFHVEALDNFKYSLHQERGIDEGTLFYLMQTMDTSDQYSRHGNKLKSSITILINRCNLDMIDFTLDFCHHLPTYELMKSMINHAQEAKNIPDKELGNWCQWCFYSEFCNENEVASPNCRTCASSTIDSGQFVCHHGSELCDKHVYHPDFMGCAGYSAQGVDTERMIIDYGDFVTVPVGEHVEGRANFTSKELYKVASSHFHTDDTFLKIMEEFDARLEL